MEREERDFKIKEKLVAINQVPLGYCGGSHRAERCFSVSCRACPGIPS